MRARSRLIAHFTRGHVTRFRMLDRLEFVAI
jgi:hypothetical protein